MKMVVLIVGIIVIVCGATMSIVIPQLMVKSVAKRVAQYKYKDGIPVDQMQAVVTAKRCKSYEEGRCRTIKQASDCEIKFLLADGEERYIMVPYGIYMQVKEGVKGTLYLQAGEYRDFREEL